MQLKLEYKEVTIISRSKRANKVAAVNRKVGATFYWKEHPDYVRWRGIKKRCYTKSNGSYHRYGGLGVTMFKPWINDFELFVSYISKLPKYGIPGLTIDRKNPYGNYEPNNLRWATKSEQRYNRRNKFIGQGQKISINNTSGYTGITINKRSHKYYSNIKVNTKNIYLGLYININDAIKARNNYIINNSLVGYSIQ